ncbi:ATP-binding protein [bacterium]|nr:ATP-binding protein [bacterium]
MTQEFMTPALRQDKRSLVAGVPTIEKIELSKRYEIFKVESKDMVPGNSDEKPVKLFKICELSHDEKYPRREAMENVISSLARNNDGEFNFVYFLDGNNDKVSVYLGIANAKGESGTKSKLNVSDFFEVLESSFRGNFTGSNVEKLKADPDDKKDEVKIGSIKLQKKIGYIVGVPSLSKHDKSQLTTDFQGIDRLINAMRGTKSWQLMLVCEAVSFENICEFKKRFNEEYDRLAPLQYVDQNIGFSHAKSEGSSHAESTSKGKNKTISENHGDSRDSKGTSTGINEGTSTSDTDQRSESNTRSLSGTRKYENKEVTEIIEYFKKVLTERINTALTKGFFKTAIYTFASDKVELMKLQNNIISIFQGDESSFCSLHPVIVDETDEKLEDLKKKIAFCRILEKDATNGDSLLPVINSTPCIENKLSFATYLTPKEISIVAGIPTKEVNGISLRESVEFGVNIPPQQDSDKIELGFILDRGSELKENKVSLTKSDLNKHIFVAGVTGAGKTVTCQKILLESGCPWCVIEPAKTEYRSLINKKDEKDEKISVFTLGNENCSPFRLNPFELMRGETVAAHADMLKAAFTASFSMEAAMPQLVEEAVYKVYEKKGWDLDDTGDEKKRDFPNISEFTEALKEVCKDKEFGERLQGEYSGSLIARFGSLERGGKGAMLNCRKSFNFEKLIEQKIVFELEELKDPADKALLMSLILMKLAHAAKLKYKEYKEKDKKFRHITLIEEAHRVLSKPEPGLADSKKYGVQVFADMIAEVRKYGESFVITDQIPAQLTPEVIKNTNTKIIHKIFSRDDKEIVGSTMSLNDKQKDYLSKMKVGEAVMFSQGWDKAVNVKIKMTDEKLPEEPDDDEVREKCADKYLLNERRFVKFVNKNCNQDSEEKIPKFKLEEIDHAKFVARFVESLAITAKKHEAEKFIKEILESGLTIREVRESEFYYYFCN